MGQGLVLTFLPYSACDEGPGTLPNGGPCIFSKKWEQTAPGQHTGWEGISDGQYQQRCPQGTLTLLGAGRGRCGVQSTEGQNGSSKALAKGVGVGTETEIRHMDTDTRSCRLSGQVMALRGTATRGRGQGWARPAPGAGCGVFWEEKVG